MRGLRVGAAVAAAGAALGACTETPVSVPVRSLERSGEVSFLCVTRSGEGRDIDSCPDFDDEDGETRRLLALVTQTLRGEVAVIDLEAGSVVDVDPSTPGYGFLPIGAMPGDIVSTPGGVASFVGVGEPGMAGIYALPSSCVWPPDVDERTRDLTSWPACSLPSAPGQMAVLIDPADAEGRFRASCDGLRGEVPVPVAAEREVCPADLSLETAAPGRRKLVVALPDEGMLALIDAQTLLDREPGRFEPCPVERWVELRVQLPAGPIEQPLPDDLVAEGCVEPNQTYDSPTGELTARPAGFAVSDGVLYVADQDAPVIHRLAVSDPCAPIELPPLLPLSLESPGRVVTTKRVAVSPLTTTGERFVYAVDDRGGVMIFDVSPGSVDRTPLVRSGSPLLPPDVEKPDRITVASPVKDVAFVLRDEPVTDPVTGVALLGLQCDPDPFDSGSLGAEYRPDSDFRSGARPRHLRGIFGFLMLASGDVAVIDVEDFDAPCRRPVRSNSAAEEDYRGCANDPVEPGVPYTEGGGESEPPTVSGETSCRVFDRHRARSGSFVLSSQETGVSGPSLRALPALRDGDGSSLITDDGEDGRKHPKLLAVAPPDPADPEQALPIEIHVGTTLYSDVDETNRIDVDPGSAAQNSVTLIHRQPRAFYPSEEFTLTYEGEIVERPAGLLRLSEDPGALQGLEDGYARFCDRGVQDEALAREVGAGFGLDGEELEAFVLRHTDYVQITASIPDEDDSYWSDERSVGYTCGDQGGGNGYFACQAVLGTAEEPTPARDLRVVEAYDGGLSVYPRASARADYVDLLYCCFGAGQVLSYSVRAGHQWVLRGSGSGFQHDVVEGADGRCVRDCRPLHALHRGRAFEVATEQQVEALEEELTAEVAGAAPEQLPQVCVFASDPEDEAEPGDRLPEPLPHDSPCVFRGLTQRFAVYRGREASERGMAFTWDVTGGFSPLGASLVTAGGTSSVSPQSMVYVPQLASLAVVDGAQKGLTFINLDSVTPSFMYY